MYQSEFCNVSYISDLNIVYVKWKKNSRGDGHRASLRYAIEIMKAHPGCNYCSDMRAGIAYEDADTQWFFTEFLPAIAQTSCEKIFIIIDKDSRSEGILKDWAAVLGGEFEVQYCFSLEEVGNALLTDEKL